MGPELVTLPGVQSSEPPAGDEQGEQGSEASGKLTLEPE
jgi:hypothetical protein